jgi:phosphatidylethanolamine/phosphatidyl-N-methylethanolamine N-methyltransferase
VAVVLSPRSRELRCLQSTEMGPQFLTDPSINSRPVDTQGAGASAVCAIEAGTGADAMHRDSADDLAGPMASSELINTYRRYAPLYDLLFGSVLEQGRRRMAALVDELKPASLLEIGVGTGLTLFRYPQESAVVGIDISSEMLSRAQAKADRLSGRNITLLTMDAEHLRFPDHSFDCVTLPYVLSVTPNPQRLIQELRRVCKPDGTILILNHFSGSRFWWFLERVVRPLADKVGFRSDFSLKEYVLAHDWKIESMQSVNPFGLSKLIAIRNHEGTAEPRGRRSLPHSGRAATASG